MNNERPIQGAMTPHGTPGNDERELADNEDNQEPEHPLVETKEERAVVHVHSGDRACSGAVLGPRIVATSRRCLGHPQGVTKLGKADGVKVELASTSLTWTQREGASVLVPACERREMDLAIVVLAEPAAWVEPFAVASAPGPGAGVEAIGYGRCDGPKTKALRRTRILEREDEELVLDASLCRGDIGGPVLDGPAGGVIGLISHRHGARDSPRRETAAVRLDTRPARTLVEQARSLAGGTDPATLKPVTCKMD